MQRKKTIYLLAVLALLVSMLPLGAAAQGGPSAPFGIQEYAPSDNKALDGTGASGAALPLAPEGMSLYVETEPNETVTVEVQGPSIELRKTVGTDPGACATTDEITLPVGGGDVTYCYAVDNTGNVTLNLHDLDDSELGNLFSGLTYALMPGASAFVTETTTIAVTTVNAATWTAYNAGGPSVQATDVATVTVEVQGPSIELRKTVGTDPGACATTDEITLPVAGSDVTYCYEVENTGDITLNLHDLDDSELGSILSGFSYALAPGASVFLTQTTPINVTTVNTATWTAYNAGGPAATVTATATVTVASIEVVKTVGTDSAVCAADSNITVPAGSEVYYCYTVTNTGDVTLNLHDLDDDQLGTIFMGLNYALTPGSSVNTVAAGLTIPAIVNAPTLNTATWTAYNAGGVEVFGEASAFVDVIYFSCQNPVENFEGGVPPLGWVVVNNVAGGPEWTDLAGCGQAGNYTGGAGDAACMSPGAIFEQPYDAELRTPEFSLVGYSDANFSYLANYQNWAGIDQLDLDISTDGGATWATLRSWDSDQGAFQNTPGVFVNIDLAAYLGMDNLMLRWHYYIPNGISSLGWYAQVDQADFTCVQIPPTAVTLDGMSAAPAPAAGLPLAALPAMVSLALGAAYALRRRQD